METNNLTIIPPEGMEAYQDGNEIKFRLISKKEIGLSGIYAELFNKKDVWRIGFHDVNCYPKDTDWNYFGNCTSKKQAEKLLAINKLMNVAKYLNNDWTPDWNNTEMCKYYMYIDTSYDTIEIGRAFMSQVNDIYFKSSELVRKAIEILGVETIRLALSSDW